MAIEIENEVVETTDPTSDRPERAERIDDRHPRDRNDSRRSQKDLRATLKSAVKEVREAEKTPRTPERKPEGVASEGQQNSSQDGGRQEASPAKTEIPSAPKPSETASFTAPQAQEKVAAPAALSKEVKAVWDTLPPAVQAEFARREADTQKGVDQLKAKYKPIEDAFTPVRGQLQQLGKTEAEAVTQLLAWQAALAGPNKVLAARALLQSHGIDLRTLTGQPAANGAQPNPNPDPIQAFRPMLDPLMQKVSSLENVFQQQQRERVQSDIANLSKDKPHFDKVRVVMGHLINTGIAQGANPKEAFDDAYERACRADPEVFAAIQQEADAKREADAKASQEAAAKKAAEDAEAKRKAQLAEVEKAKRAGIGPRAGSPSGMAIAAAAKGKSVGDSIRDAVKATRGQI